MCTGVKCLVTAKALSALFNDHILAYSPRPLDDMEVKTEEGYMVATGGLKLWSWFPGIWLPATLGGKMVLSPENKLVYELDNVSALGIPLLGLLKTIGVKLTWLLSSGAQRRHIATLYIGARSPDGISDAQYQGQSIFRAFD